MGVNLVRARCLSTPALIAWGGWWNMRDMEGCLDCIPPKYFYSGFLEFLIKKKSSERP